MSSAKVVGVMLAYIGYPRDMGIIAVISRLPTTGLYQLETRSAIFGVRGKLRFPIGFVAALPAKLGDGNF